MSTEIAEPALTSGIGLGPPWNIIVLNDDHHTFDEVAGILARRLPGVDIARGHALANEIHHTGQAIVWSGHRELAELYWETLAADGLSMAPLEQGP